MESSEKTQTKRFSAREAALALACFLGEYNWPLRVPTATMPPAQIWSCPDRLLAGLLKLPDTGMPKLASFRETFSPEKMSARIDALGQQLAVLGEVDYPGRLRQIHDPPPALFARAADSAAIKRLAGFSDRPCVAIVGSRGATRYGIDAATSIARELSAAGVCVVSGMAFGIDAAAHRGAIEADGGTIAVLGSGLDVVYPRAHRQLYASILEKGVAVSEYPPGTKPMPWRFPARNRIMAGLADAVLVVEAGAKSGALITADFALEEGREVLAVPGSIYSEMSAGSHRLLRQGAGLVEGAGDILEALGWENAQLRLDTPGHAAGGALPAASRLTPDERSIYSRLDARPRHQDELARQAGLDPQRTAAALLSLELAGLARLEPGRGYSR